VGKENIIELNGKHYDALTGKIIGDHMKKMNEKTKPKPVLNPVSSKNMDGFTKRRKNTPNAHAQQARTIQKSRTLMRKTVKMPITHKVHSVTSTINHADKTSNTNKTLLKTKSVPNNSHIRRFGLPRLAENIASTNNIVTPKHPATPAATPVPLHSKTIPKVDPLRQAIQDATSHHEPKLKRQTRHQKLADRFGISSKILSGGSVMLALLLMTGFFAFQNVPNIKMRVAANRAGLNGSLPTYQPPGFRLNNISYKTGEINVSFQSNSDQRNFKLSQVASSWNSNTLRDKLRASSLAANSPMEVPSKGKTLFISSDSSVTWVDGGILYKIDGESKLTGEQLVNIASSL